MADSGLSQHAFNFPVPLVSALRGKEIVVDLFCGGGGASEALRQALGRDPDIAINHDELAIGMHAANHPLTRHMREDVWEANPVAEVDGRPVGWLHASPDCTHFSQAKGGQPRSRATRSLSWVVLKWAGTLAKARRAPRVISLENVEQILKWGPLVAKRDKATGRVLRLDGSVAGKGERVPLERQYLIPDPRHAGRTWRQFVAELKRIGYAVDWRRLIASDFGAGTSRKRLFLVARRDGMPIRWPEATHGKALGLLPQVTAADCIDWSIPCPSIFERKRELAEATKRRIAKGIQRFVLDAAEPFIVGVGGRMGQSAERSVHSPMQTVTAKADSAICVPTLVQCANASANGVAPASAPLGTITAWPKGGSHALASAHLVKFRGDSQGSAIDSPVPTITSGAGAARPAGAAHALGVVTAFLEQANGGWYDGAGNDVRKPVPTICGTGSQQRLVTANLATLRRHSTGTAADAPLATISAGGEHHALVECTLSPEHEAGALRVAAFLINYYGNGQALDLLDPVDTITTRDRLALVTVVISGMPYVIVDIGLRMLQPHELYRSQGFPPDYIIDRTADGRRLSNSAAVRMVGNSVSPPPLLAVARANLDPAETPERMAA